ncbi:MAG: hypothetical protein UV88_C0021G0005 [Parcubacteria group bacterium GW2011_GWA1_43_21]|nr:MAG: hypothetical protein UV88_C0021G0005 [Parcubacteria group bacterium GW2011_GWA1_43_21]
MKAFLKITVFLLLILPLSVSALGFDYATMSFGTCGDLRIQSGALENKTTYYHCDPKTLTCDQEQAKECGLTDPTQDNLLKTLRSKYKEIWNASRIQFSPDNNYLVYYISSKVNKDKIRHHVLFDLRDISQPRWSEITSKVPNWDLLTEENRLFAFAPDESFVIYLDDRDGYSTLYQTQLPQTGKKLIAKKLISRNYSIGDFLVWDKNTIYFYTNREQALTWSLYRFNLTTRDLKKITDNISYGEKLQRVDDYLLFTRLAGNRKLVSRYDPTTGAVANFQIPSLAKTFPQLVRKNATIAKRQVSVVRTEKKIGQPLIIWLHGGPYRQVAGAGNYHAYQSYATYDWLLDELAQTGAIVAKVDYVGSYGYGRQFADTIVGQVGKKDVADILALTTELKTMYQPSAIYLIGNSYGGYLSLRTLVEKPTNYTGAISINGVTHWSKLLDYYQNSIFNTYFHGLRGDDNDPLFQETGITERLDRVTKQKILIVQNDSDKTIPPSQATWLVDILDRRQKPYEFVTYADEDHTFAQSKNLINLCQKIASFTNIASQCQW